jgi:hypothetical protein
MNHEPLIPDIEEHIPLPKNAAEALPAMSPREELEGIANTIKDLSDYTGTSLAFDETDVEAAKKTAKEIIENPKTRPNYNALRDSTKAVLAGMVAQYDFEVVDDLIQLKNFVVNALLDEYKNASESKTRIQALSKLGEIDGVDAFKKRTETTHIIKPIEEVEKELMQVLEGIEYKVIEDDKSEITHHAE